ncbi:MAG: cytidylate kinase family protein [Armatimonadetes bacterium]|nr:cytidylate kinase family protein [Armatimonadota bacterium]
MNIKAIAIAGDAGSGKTTAAGEIAARLPGWRVVSTGQRFREYCRERGIDPSAIASLPDEIHRAADDDMRRLLAGSQRVIAEGRLVGWLAAGDPTLLRVWCDAPLDTRAARYAFREGIDIQSAREEIAHRDAADAEKFQRLYGIDYRDPRLYDLRVDTGRLPPDAVARAILDRLQRDP